MDFDSRIDQLSKISPILEVPRTPVDLVNDHALCLPLTELPHHLREDGAASLCRTLALFKPLRDDETVSLRVLADCVLLLLEGNSLFSLFGGGDAGVSEIASFHKCYLLF